MSRILIIFKGSVIFPFPLLTPLLQGRDSSGQAQTLQQLMYSMEGAREQRSRAGCPWPRFPVSSSASPLLSTACLDTLLVTQDYIFCCSISRLLLNVPLELLGLFYWIMEPVLLHQYLLFGVNWGSLRAKAQFENMSQKP